MKAMRGTATLLPRRSESHARATGGVWNLGWLKIENDKLVSAQTADVPDTRVVAALTQRLKEDEDMAGRQFWAREAAL